LLRVGRIEADGGRGHGKMTKVFLLAFFIWLILHNLQKLLSKWRVKRVDDPDAELVVDDSSRWNYFLKKVIGFLKLVVVVAALFLAVLLTQMG